MSFILEALRKSERQRRELEAQPLVRLAAYPAGSAERRWRPVAITLLVIINLAALIFLVRYLAEREAPGARPNVPAARANAPDEQAATARAAAEALGADLAEPSSPPLGFAEAPAGRKPPEASRAAQSARAKKRPRESTEPARPAAARRPVQPAALARIDRDTDSEDDLEESPSEATGSLDKSVRRQGPPQRPKGKPKFSPAQRFSGGNPVEPGLADAPPAPPVQDDRLPRPKINVYAYSATTGRERFIVIRGRKYHEGDHLEDGPAIRRIEETAVTLDFDGQTYKVPRP